MTIILQFYITIYKLQVKCLQNTYNCNKMENKGRGFMIMELLSEKGRTKEGVLLEAFLREKEIYIAVKDKDILLFETEEGEQHIIVYTSLDIIDNKIKNLNYKKISLKDLMNLLMNVGGFDFCAINPFTDLELSIEGNEDLNNMYNDVLITRILDNPIIYIATFNNHVAKISDGLITSVKIYTEKRYLPLDDFEYNEMISLNFKEFLKECGEDITHVVINRGTLDETYSSVEDVKRVLNKII